MAKIKLTKNELKKQKDALKMYTRYLPTLILKKQQLQMEIQKVEKQTADVELKRNTLQRDLNRWIAVFGEDVGFNDSLLTVEEVKIGSGKHCWSRHTYF